MKKFTKLSFALLCAAGLGIGTTNAQLSSPGGIVNPSTTGLVGVGTNSPNAPLEVAGNNILLRPTSGFNPNGKFIGIGESGGFVGPVNGCNLYGFRAQKSRQAFINVGIQQIVNPVIGGDPQPIPLVDDLPTISWGSDATGGGIDPFPAGISRGLFFRYDNTNTNCGSLVAQMRGTGTYRFIVYGSALASGGSWVNSDARFKQNIEPIRDAMDVITQLEGTTYTMDRDNFPDRNFNAGTQYGFIAQDLQKVMPTLVMEDDEGFLGVNYDAVVPVLVEGMKAQQSQLEAQTAELEIANNLNEELNNRVEEQEVVLQQQDAAIRQLQAQMQAVLNGETSKLEGAAIENNVEVAEEKSALFQNRPNPALTETQISFYLPTTVKQASLVIYNADGREMKRYDNLSRGYANVLLQAGDLPAGNYLYRLVADNEIVGSKTLVLAK